MFGKTGGSGPALVLIHGFPEDSSAWIGLLSKLGRRFTILAPEMRGIGQSSAPADARYDDPTLAADVKALTERLRMEHPFVLGHDMGGIVAYTLARAYPSFVRGRC